MAATDASTPHTSSCVGAATRRQMHRDRIGAITLLGLVQQSSSRHVPTYFSIVRRSPCCAARERRSTSLSTTTLKWFDALSPPVITGADCAISLMSSCTTSRSRTPASLGLSSMWWAELSSVSSIGADEPNLNVRCSTFTRSTDEPCISRSSAITRVFLPAPDGPYTSMCGKSPAAMRRLSCLLSGL